MSEGIDPQEGDRPPRVVLRTRAATVSILVAILVFAAKFLAYRLTGSAAILSDALESIVNIVAASMAAFSVWYSSQPADENHPYGHGKIEDFSAGVEGALIVLAAGGILFSAVPRFFDPQPVGNLGEGTALVAVATVVNLGLGVFLVRQGRLHRSRALEADGRHVLSDVYSSAGAVAALLLVSLTDQIWIDPLVACLIAVHILVSGFALIRESVGRLMDEADEEALEQLAAHLAQVRRPAWVDVHELRAWWSGDVVHVDAHIMLPRYWSIETSHVEAEALASEMGRGLSGRTGVVVHVDPCRDSYCASCAVPDCPIRAHVFAEQESWDRAHLVRLVGPDEPSG